MTDPNNERALQAAQQRLQRAERRHRAAADVAGLPGSSNLAREIAERARRELDAARAALAQLEGQA